MSSTSLIGKREKEQLGALQAQAAHSDLSRSKSVEQPTVAKHSSSQSSDDEHTNAALDMVVGMHR